jgi:hypothetical protein
MVIVLLLSRVMVTIRDIRWGWSRTVLDGDIPRLYLIRESGHRIHDPLTGAKLADLGAALRVPAGARLLDLACGSGRDVLGVGRRSGG